MAFSLPWLLPVQWAHGQPTAEAQTIPARLEACAAAENGEPARAIELAGEVLGEPAATVAEQVAALGCRGWALARLGQRDDARDDAQALQAGIDRLAPSPERAVLLRRAGAILHVVQDRIAAVDLYSRAEAELTELGLESERIPLLVNLAVLHSELRETERALLGYQQALDLMERLDEWRFEAPVRFNLGVMLAAEERWAEALLQLLRALELIQDSGMGGPSHALRARMNIAHVLLRLDRVGEAMPFLEALREDPLVQDDPSLRAEWLGVEAEYRLAIDVPAAALDLLAQMDGAVLTEVQQGLRLARQAHALESLGRHAEAIAIVRQIQRQREDFLVQQNLERLAALDARLRDHEQRMALEGLQRDAQIQAAELAHSRRLQWLTGFVAMLLLLGVLVALLWQLRMNRKLEGISRTDLLTGLPNRRDMLERLAAAVRPSARPAIAVLVDIDHFKQINDRLGHEAGDAALRQCALRLQRFAAAAGGIAGRWGGEEFLLLLPGSQGEAGLPASMDALLQSARESSKAAADIALTVSAGHAPLPLPQAGVDWQASLQLADAALYAAKQAGRDAWAGYWVRQAHPDWAATRLAAEPAQAHIAGVLGFAASRSAADALQSMG